MNQQLRLFVDLVLHHRYKIINELGSGGMGAVYEALDLQEASRRVAIKQMLPHALDLRQAFEREADILSRLQHAHLPHVTDCFEEETGLFMAMQFIPGSNLGQLLANRELPFPPHQVKKWAEDLLTTLDYLHTREPRIIHRDIKPNNLKLAPDGRLILLDFGLAREISQSEEDNPTEDICILAYTPHYAPPEQIQGLHTDRYSDIYALGATLYHLLTGKPPVDSLKRLREKRLTASDPLKPIGQIIRGVPQALALMIMRSLSLDPHERPSSAAEMLSHLQLGTIAARFQPASLVTHQTVASEATVVLTKPAVISAPDRNQQRLAPRPTRIKVQLPTVLPDQNLPERRGNVLAFSRFRKPKTDSQKIHLPLRANIASAILILFTIAAVAHYVSRSLFQSGQSESMPTASLQNFPPSPSESNQYPIINAEYVATAPPLPDIITVDDLVRFRARYLKRKIRLRSPVPNLTSQVPIESSMF